MIAPGFGVTELLERPRRASRARYHRGVFNLGGTELVFLFVLALLIFGPKRLPQIGRTLGKGMAEFRRASTELQRAVNTELEEPPAWRAQPAVAAPAAAVAATVAASSSAAAVLAATATEPAAAAFDAPSLPAAADVT